MQVKKIISIMAGATLVVALMATALPASADTGVKANVNVNAKLQGNKMMGRDDKKGEMRPMMKPGVMGKVTAINGTTITLTGRQFAPNAAASTTFTIDASAAVVMKNNATSTLSAITVNDTIFVEGTITGTNVVATTIHDGALGRGNGQPWGDKGHTASSTLAITGNGQPVVAGKVTAINGSSITITNSSNVTYTVEASSAKILEGKNTSTLSSIQVGDSILVQGTTNGTSITASTVIEQTMHNNGNQNGKGKARGLFGSIGSFFSRLFGF